MIEEMDELWDHIKANTGRSAEELREALLACPYTDPGCADAWRQGYDRARKENHAQHA